MSNPARRPKLSRRLRRPRLHEAFADVQTSVERFCLLAGIEVLQDMTEQDARGACGGQQYARSSDRQAYRWGASTECARLLERQGERAASARADFCRRGSHATQPAGRSCAILSIGAEN